MTEPRVEALAAWFRRSARDLPWRRRRTGYRALVSEIMLQQTQVVRVVDSYRQFMHRFPTIKSLAEADEQDVLAAWNGLGYYRRARHLHAAARMIRDEFHGRVPRDAEDLRRLPGVGRYVAGSIASIVFGHRAPIVDGNVARVLARWFARDDSPSDRAFERWAWAEAGRLVDHATDPGAFNEGMMELGATVCTPASPSCDRCPVSKFCLARHQGRQHEIPRPKRRAKQHVLHHHAVVVERRGCVLLVQRPATGLWSGLWQAPTVEAERALAPSVIRKRLSFSITSMLKVTAFDYQTTHRRVTFHVYRGRTRARGGDWRAQTDLPGLAMGNAQRRAIDLGLGRS